MVLITLQVGPLSMAQDERWFEKPGPPRIHQLRQTYRESAATETVAECLEAADRVAALLATLPRAEAERYATYLSDMLENIREHLHLEQ